MRGINTFLIAISVSLLIIVAALFNALVQHPPYAPNVKPEHQSKNSLQAHQSDDKQQKTGDGTSTFAPKVLSESTERKRQSEANDGEQEGTEFWPTIFSVRLKITDTLVALFTALLFFATLALWWATRGLVVGADETARRQLRAYISIMPARLRRINPT